MDEPQNNIRVCIVNEFFYPDDTGGTGTVLSGLAESLRNDYGDQLQIDVITSRYRYRSGDDGSASPPSALASYEEWQGTRIFRVDAPPAQGRGVARRLAANTVFSAQALFHLLRQCRREGRCYDALLIGTAPPTLAAMAHIVKRLTGTPYLYVIYDLEPDRAIVMRVMAAHGRAAKRLRRFQKQWMDAAAKIVVLGRCMQEYVQETYQIPEDKVIPIAIGCDPQTIMPMARESAFRKRQNLASDRFVVEYSGNFGRYHDFDTVLDAAKGLAKTDPLITFVLVGGGAQREHIVRRVRDESIENVRVFGFVEREEYADLLATADASLVTLEPGMEGLCVPSKFYSILASGRPTIGLVAETSEVARVIAEEACGVQVNTGDAEALIAVVRSLSSDASATQRMGENARRALVQRFASPVIAREYRDALYATAATAKSGDGGDVRSFFGTVFIKQARDPSNSRTKGERQEKARQKARGDSSVNDFI